MRETYHPSSAMAVTLWNAEYHHLAFRDDSDRKPIINGPLSGILLLLIMPHFSQQIQGVPRQQLEGF